jgi:hypothetical protein
MCCCGGPVSARFRTSRAASPVREATTLLALAADLSRDTDTVAHWEDMLRWPVAWTARRGSAEIRVPVLTVGASTDEANDDASVVLTAAAD